MDEEVLDEVVDVAYGHKLGPNPHHEQGTAGYVLSVKKEKKLGALGDKQQFRTFVRCFQDQWDKICKKLGAIRALKK